MGNVHSDKWMVFGGGRTQGGVFFNVFFYIFLFISNESAMFREPVEHSWVTLKTPTQDY